MKKIYIVPQTLTVNVKLQQVITASGGNMLMSGDAVADGEVLSRESGHHSIWDDDEE